MSSSAVLRIFESELERIKECVLDSPDIETGGELIGLWSHADSPTVMLAGVTVMLAGGPSDRSRRAQTFFEQDPETHMELERLLWEGYGVQVVGLWHSHHELGLHVLSAGDIRRTQHYSARHKRPRYSEILAYLLGSEGSPKRRVVGLRPHVYADASTGVALFTSLEILPGESPLRQALSRVRVSPDVDRVIGARWRHRHDVSPHRVDNYVPDRGSSASPAERGSEGEDVTFEADPAPDGGDDAAPSTEPRRQRSRILPWRRASEDADEPVADDSSEGQVVSDVPRQAPVDWLLSLLETSVRRALPDHTDLRLGVDMPAPDVLLVTIESDRTSQIIRLTMRARRPDDLSLRLRVEDRRGRVVDSYRRSPASSADLVEMLRQGARTLGHRSQRTYG